jgi:hypothetical protein
MIVLVELSTVGDYDSEGNAYDYKEIGEVYGPFETRADALEHGQKLNDARGYYVWNGRTHRVDMRDFEVKEVTAPR